MTGLSMPASPAATRMLEDLEAAPTPYHAVEHASRILRDSGFRSVELGSPLPQGAGRFTATFGGLMIAWVVPERPTSGFVLVGAHTDSPNLRVRTHPDLSSGGFAQVGMEIYGGVLLNSWLDRDLGLAGRVMVRTDPENPSNRSLRSILIRDDRPILRVPQLAIHLHREIKEKGLQLDPQLHMTPIWALGDGSPGAVRDHVAELADVEPDQIVSWDLMAFDTQAPAIVGRDGDMIASARIDNLFSSFCGVHALVEAANSDEPTARVPVLVLYDHEEVGSSSATGAGGATLSNLLERITNASGGDRIAHLESLASSLVISADGAHATHPNYVDKHEPNHQIALNGGVVVKRNSNQRYASDAASESPFRLACAEADVPVQTYIHRNDLPCGSTIGPITAAQLGVPTVDVGAPQLAMHSIRELAGVDDVQHLINALAAMWRLA